MDEIIILANGDFPTHPTPLGLLRSGLRIVCCDGAAQKLISSGIVPAVIIGDMDSLDPELQEIYSERIIRVSSQEANDLTKAFIHTLTLQPSKIYILGATGFREDHTLGNISLLSQYHQNTLTGIEMITDTGRFIPISKTHTFQVPAGSSVSVFSLDSDIKISSSGLQYPLDEVVFDSWWKATLNITDKNYFTLNFVKGRVIVYIAF